MIPVVLLNTLGVLFVYRLARDVAGLRAALAAGLLFALAPWIVHFSHRPWHPGLYPLLVPATAYFLIRALRAPRDRATPPLLAGMACFGLLINTSLIGYLAIPQMLATLWLGRRRFKPRAVAAGAGLLLLMSVPYAAGLWPDRASVLERLGQYWSTPARADLEALRHAVRLVSGHLYPQVFFNDGSAAVGTLSTAAEVAHWLLTSALFVGMVLSLRDALGGRDPHGVHRALLAWVVLPILVLTAHRNLVYPRYLMITIKALPRSPLAA